MKADKNADLSLSGKLLGAVLWPSFFAAGVANMVCFALVDPLALRDISLPNWEISRELGYTIGFFVFWLFAASSSAFTAWLLHPMLLDKENRRDHPDSSDPP